MKIAVLKDLSGRSVNSHDKEAKTNVTGHFIRVVLRQRKLVGTNENTFTQNQRWFSMGGVAAYRVCHVTCIKYLQHVTSFQSLDVTESRVPSPHTPVLTSATIPPLVVQNPLSCLSVFNFKIDLCNVDIIGTCGERTARAVLTG